MESLKANKKWRKISLILQYSFDQKTSLILRISTHLTLKIICSRNTVKNLSDLHIHSDLHFLYTFSSKHVSVCCQKKHLPCTITRRPRNSLLKHFESKCLYISIYLRRRYFIPKTGKILSDEGWVGGLGETELFP